MFNARRSSQCTGSKKSRAQLTSLWHHDRLWGEEISRLRYAWCNDCVFIEEACLLARALPKKSKCRRATCSERRPILTREAHCLHDLWPFSCKRSLWRTTSPIKFVQYTLKKDDGPGRFIKVKIAGFCSASDCIGSVSTRDYSKQWTTKLFQIGDISKTSYWSNDEKSKPQSPKRSDW